ncbi:MAG: MAPEG family protein [Hellea sp.]|nr:MAPEG family protein [Hellea sp.]
MQHFLTPVLALILWTFVIWIWMYKRRIPAMLAITKNTQDFIDNPALGEQLPAKAKWAADNYNHLHEQPVIFYALMFYLHAVELTPDWMLYLACAYVGIRILHSLVQVTSNKVNARFGLFALGSIILMVMATYAGGFLVGGMLA